MKLSRSSKAQSSATMPDWKPEIRRRLAALYLAPTLDSFKQAGVAVPSVAELEGKGFFIIESEADLLSKWERIMAGKPDFIKTILCHSESFARRRENSDSFRL